MDFLNLPSAAHVERLTRRVRSLSQRLEAIEESLGRLEEGLHGGPSLAQRLDAIEGQLAETVRLLGSAPAPGSGPVSPGQERLGVDPQPPFSDH
jgi:hypothetical protein